MHLLPQTSKLESGSVSFGGLFLPNLNMTSPSPTSRSSSASSPVNQISSPLFNNFIIQQKANIDCSPFKVASKTSPTSASITSSIMDLNKKFNLDLTNQKNFFYSQLMSFLQQQQYQAQPIQPNPFQFQDYSKFKPQFSEIVSSILKTNLFSLKIEKLNFWLLDS